MRGCARTERDVRRAMLDRQAEPRVGSVERQRRRRADALNPGRARSRSDTASKKATVHGCSPYRADGSVTGVITSCAGWNPGDTLIRLLKLTMSSDAPVSSTSDSASSATTSADRRRAGARALPLPPRDSSFSPTPMPVVRGDQRRDDADDQPGESDNAIAAVSTRASMPTSAMPGSPANCAGQVAGKRRGPTPRRADRRRRRRPR